MKIYLPNGRGVTALHAGSSPCHPGMEYRQFDEVKLPVELPGSFPPIM